MSGASAAVHPEVQQDTSVVRWIATGRVDSFSEVAERPAPGLAELLREGTLVEVRGGVGWIETVLSPGLSWSAHADAVRRAVVEHILATEPRDLSSEDLHSLARSVLAREVAPLAGAHGGRIEITGVRGHTVTVRLDGACHGCPAAKTTLQDRFQASLRQWDPLAEVVDRDGSAVGHGRRPRGGRTWLPLPGFRH